MLTARALVHLYQALEAQAEADLDNNRRELLDLREWNSTNSRLLLTLTSKADSIKGPV